jgi:hypothetical protein
MESKWVVENTAPSPAPAPAAPPAAEKTLLRPCATAVPPGKTCYGLVGLACGVGGLLVGFLVGLNLASGPSGKQEAPGLAQVKPVVPVAEKKPMPASATPQAAVVPELLPRPQEEPIPEEKPAVVIAKPQAVPVAVEALPPGELPPAPAARPGTETYGTAVDFMINPLEALELASKEKKLMFVMHISGNFEDAKFT